MIDVIFAAVGIRNVPRLLRAALGVGGRRLAAVLLSLAWVLGLGGVSAQAAVNLEISVGGGAFSVPSTNATLSIVLKNTGTTAASFSSGVANFTLQLPPHMAISARGNASNIVCNYWSGSAATTGLVVSCSPSITSLAAGAQVAFTTYAFADAGAIGVAGTVRAAVDATGGNAWVKASTCTSTGMPSSGCFVGPLSAAYSAGGPIMAMRVGAPSTTVVGQAAQFSLDMFPYLLAGGTTSVTVNSFLAFYFQLPPYYTLGSVVPKAGRPNSSLGHSCTLVGGSLSTGLSYSCYNNNNASNVTLSNATPSGAAGWLVTATPSRFVGGQMRASTTPIPGGVFADGGYGGAGNYADPQTCAADDVVLGCGYGAGVPGGPDLGLALSNPGTLSVGATTPYILTLTNRGTLATGSTLVVYSQLPANVQYSAVSPDTSGSVTASAVSCSASGTVSAGQLLTCTVTLPTGGLDANQSTALSLSVTPLAAASGASTTHRAAVDPSGNNAAQTPSTCTGTDWPNAGCAVASAITVGTGVSLQLSKSNPPALVTGTAAGYGLVISNVGTGPTGTSLVLYDQLPANFVYTSVSNATPTGGTAFSAYSCANYSGSLAAGWLVRCTLTLPTGGLAAGSSAGITFNATPQAAASGVSSANLASIDPTGANAVQAPSTCTGNGTPSQGCAVAPALVPNGAAAAQSRVTIGPAGPLAADGAAAYTITATAYNGAGTLVSAQATTFSFSAPGAGAALSASSCTTATSGGSAGTCSVTLKATTPGSYSVTASLGGSNVGGTNPVVGAFTAGTVTAGSSKVVISSGPKLANGSDAYTITVSAYDANGNLNTTAASTFSFSAPGTGAALSASTCTTATTGGGAGTCSVTLTATTAGSYAITATLGGTNVGGTNPVTGTFTAGSVTADGSRVAISAGPKVANGSDAYTLTVTANDANGNLSSSVASTFSFSAPSTGAALSASSCTTATTGDGHHSRQLQRDGHGGGHFGGWSESGHRGVCGRGRGGGLGTRESQRRAQGRQRRGCLHAHGQRPGRPGQSEHQQRDQFQLQRPRCRGASECGHVHHRAHRRGGRHMFGHAHGHGCRQLQRDSDTGRYPRGGHQPGHGGVRGCGHGRWAVAGQHHPDRHDQDGQRCGFVHHHRNGP